MQTYIIILTTLLQLAITEFDCQENEIIDETCSKELSCIYQPTYEARKGFSRFCRCKTVISDLPLDDNMLLYSSFKNVCSLHETRLHQLWVVDAELEYIDNEIFEKYPNLKYVNLAGNNLILNFTEKAAMLTDLDLSNNGLNAVHKHALKNLKSLKMVNISFNRLDQVNFCFEENKELEEVYLNNNQLTRISRNEFDHLLNLRVLNLAHNFLSIIDSNMFLINLQELHLNNNKLSTINKQELIHLPNLKILKIGDNLITGLGDRYTFNNLEEFHCENNQLKNVNKNVMSKLQKLKFLNYSNNQIENLEANTFPLSNSLNVVDISSNKLTVVDPNNFKNFNNVSILNFNNNSLTEKIINCDNMQNLKKVNVLYLSFNKILEIYNCTFAKLENLSKLSLLANKLEKIPPSAFKALTKLEELNLADNQITDIPEGVFDNLKELRNLNISSNNLTMFDLNRLNNNRKITNFDIKHNKLEDLDLKLLKNKLPALQVVDLDRRLVKCDEYEQIREYFDDNRVVFGSCRRKTECCAKGGISETLIVIIAVSTIVCLLAIAGLGTIFCRCSKPKDNTIQLVPFLQNQS